MSGMQVDVSSEAFRPGTCEPQETLLECRVHLREGEGLGLRLSPRCYVTGVVPGSPASVAGVVRSMRLLRVNGAEVASPEAAKKAAAAAEAGVPLVFTLSIDSSMRLKGRVAAWLPSRQAGSIAPDVPVFLQPGLVGGERWADEASVFIGDVQFPAGAIRRGTAGNASRRLKTHQPVEFSVRYTNGVLRAHDVCPLAADSFVKEEDEAAAAAVPAKPRGGRAGADVAAHAKGAPRVCMMHLGGAACEGGEAVAGGGLCPAGAHLRNPHAALMTERRALKAAAALAPLEWVHRNNLGEENLLRFTGRPDESCMVYEKNGEERPCFTKLTYTPTPHCRVEAGSLYMPEIEKRVRVPLATRVEILHRLARMADACGVQHDIPKVGAVSDLPRDVLTKVGPSKLRLLQDKFAAAGGQSDGMAVIEAWQLRNEALEFRFRATEYNMTHDNKGAAPEMIEGYHGTSEHNVLSIAANGFDPLTRCGQVFGAGEYFARDPTISACYSQGGGYMFLCKLILGTPDADHTFVACNGFYVMKQNKGNIQCLPEYLLRFRRVGGEHNVLHKALSAFPVESEAGAESHRRLGASQRGGLRPSRGRVDGHLLAPATCFLWLGWLSPELARDEEALQADVVAFLKGHAVASVRADRNGARVGAWVELAGECTRLQVAELNARPYGKAGHRISVEDAQPGNPRMRLALCPKLSGPGRFCRGHNLCARGGRWFDACSFRHDPESFPGHGAEADLEAMAVQGAKRDALDRELRSLYQLTKTATVVHRVVNERLASAYESRRSFLQAKHGMVTEVEGWVTLHHSEEAAVLNTGFASPSNALAAPECPRSGARAAAAGEAGGAPLSCCSNDCEFCVEPHKPAAEKFMFGRGIYVYHDAADALLHSEGGPEGRKLVRCRVNLGSPFMIDAPLKTEGAMHDVVWCEDPSAYLEGGKGEDSPTEKEEDAPVLWDTLKGHDSYLVKGVPKEEKKEGRSISCKQYVVFHPASVLALYVAEFRDKHGAEA